MNKFPKNPIITTILMTACGPLLADWCQGNKFLVMDMPMSERVEKAGDALRSVTKALTQEASRLKLDMQSEAEQTRQTLVRQYSALSEETKTLCAHAQRDTLPIRYQNIELRNISEIHARLRLNLDLLTAQKAAAAESHAQQRNMGSLAEAMREKTATLSVLLRQLDAHGGNRCLACPG